MKPFQLKNQINCEILGEIRRSPIIYWHEGG